MGTKGHLQAERRDIQHVSKNIYDQEIKQGDII